MNNCSRRRILLGVSSTAAVAVAGCLDRTGESPGGGADGDENGGDREETEDGTDEENELPHGVTEASLTTVGSDCASPDDDRIEVSVEADEVTVSGVTPAPNPCHEAVLVSVELEDETLSLVVDVRDTTADDEDCIQCHGKVEYEATITLEKGTSVDSVHVDHVAGGEHGAGWERAGETDVESRVVSCERQHIRETVITRDDEDIDGELSPQIVDRESRPEGEFVALETGFGTIRSAEDEPDQHLDYHTTAFYLVAEDDVYRTGEEGVDPQDGAVVDC